MSLRIVNLMRILVTIPHYFSAETTGSADGRAHGSISADAAPRIAALASSLGAMRTLFDREQRIINLVDKTTRFVNEPTTAAFDVVICTTGGRHLLDQLPAAEFEHTPTSAEPMLLGFECHRILRDRLGDYDYYVYLEDDLVIRDPWMFLKLRWFTNQVGDDALLQPNRYEVAPYGLVKKVYLDGDVLEELVLPFQDRTDRPVVISDILGTRVLFERPLNPHSGCFFLSAAQMTRWVKRPEFLDRDTRFVGPLESAASLGIMRAFQVYKPAPVNAAFLEIEHYGTGFISQLRRRDPIPDLEPRTEE